MRKIYNNSRLFEAKKLNIFSLNKVYPEQFKLLCGKLNKVFNKPIELNLIRLHYPSEDSNILVNLMGLIIHKKNYHVFLERHLLVPFLRAFQKLNHKNITILQLFRPF